MNVTNISISRDEQGKFAVCQRLEYGWYCLHYDYASTANYHARRLAKRYGLPVIFIEKRK